MFGYYLYNFFHISPSLGRKYKYILFKLLRLKIQQKTARQLKHLQKKHFYIFKHNLLYNIALVYLPMCMYNNYLQIHAISILLETLIIIPTQI